MSYFLTEEQELIRNAAREFSQNEVEPRATAIDSNDEFPADLVKRCAELNFFGLMIPEKYGGLGANFTTACVVLEEIAKASPALAGMLSVQIVLCPTALLAAGNEAQKMKYLPASAKGEHVMALSSTEPSGTANLGAHQTKLIKNGDDYTLNGLKIFCTQGNADVYIVGARTFEGEDEGYGTVILEKGMPGFEIGRYEKKLGWRGSNTGTLIFKDVKVPKENILGGFYTGLTDITPGTTVGNLGHAASSLGLAEGIFEKTRKYVDKRELYGMSMSSLQPISYWLADIYTKIEACRSMLYSVTRLYDEGKDDGVLVSACKVFVCETALQVSNTCLQMWGGHGMMDEMGMHRYMRDARVNTIAEGSSEIHLWMIANYVLAM